MNLKRRNFIKSTALAFVIPILMKLEPMKVLAKQKTKTILVFNPEYKDAPYEETIVMMRDAWDFDGNTIKNNILDGYPPKDMIPRRFKFVDGEKVRILPYIGVEVPA